jgi:lipopolysaccharide biosynthesis glycosyltransferase
MIGNKDQNGFNAGMFLIRAHEWSISLLANAMSLKGHHPEVMVGFAEQTALYLQFNQTEYRKHVLYQPRRWFNTYEFDFAYEGSPGDMFVHFVGLFEKRWERMVKWLDVLEGPGQKEWEIPLEHTKYPHEIDEFWSVVRQGRQALAEARNKASLWPENILQAIERLETVLWSETDQTAKVRNATEALRTEIKDTTGLATGTKGGW